ncbi:carbonic anhydrase [Phellopilus nigrolimitatus]|nr:carbonic anhydrase [Phellopilus nigrolimitatus]
MTAISLPELNRLLYSNAQWAADVDKYEPSFFKESAKGQAPKVLWIGCADSRVPESVIMACKPGDIFVHRNIANQFHLSDDSAQAVLMYAVEHVGVEHIVVVGHTQCGGIAGAYNAACAHAAHGSKEAGATPLGRWLAPLIDLASQPEFAAASDPETRDATLTALSEANVRAQVENIIGTGVIKGAWAAANAGEAGRKKVYVHGWIYALQNGRLRDLGVSSGPDGPVGAKFVGGLGTNGTA